MDATLPAEIAEAERLPAAPALLRPLAGFLLLGLAGACGRGTLEAALWQAPVVLGLALLPGAMSAPLLLVLHQGCGLKASPGRLLGGVLGGFCAAGRLAAGLAPLVLFFALTSLRGTELLALSLGGSAWVGLAAARRALHAAEAEAGGSPSRMALLGLGWSALCGSIGLRLAWDAFHWLRALKGVE